MRVWHSVKQYRDELILLIATCALIALILFLYRQRIREIERPAPAYGLREDVLREEIVRNEPSFSNETK